MRSLLIVSIGPVQDFIAAARRSRDLWFGSWLLSELSKAAASSIQKQGGELIFPSPESPEDLEYKSNFIVANKITAIIDGEPARTAAEVEVAVRKRLRDVMQKAFDNIRGQFYRENAEEQVEDMLEIFIASVPLASDSEYKMALERANKLLAARKNTRDFQPVKWGSEVPKSSLDGQRESVIPEEKYDSLTPESLRRLYGVAAGERLCGVGLLKRHGADPERFFSTPHVAALSLIEAFREEHREAFNQYVSKLKDLGVQKEDLGTVGHEHKLGRYDGHILFEERLHEFLEKDKLPEAKKALSEFLKKTVKKRPIPYYCILQADGDRMGELLDKESDKETHKQISKQLSEFAKQVDTIVLKHSGSLIYAGGDDVLAMLPLHKALDCADELAQTFAEYLGDLSSVKPSLSAGIAVCHHIDPMYDALELARKAEKAAKSVDGKDALAVTISKRSGVDVTVKGKRKELIERLKQLRDYHVQDEIPDGFAYELRTLNNQFEKSELSMSIIEAEALRILGRKRRKRGSQDLAKEVKQRLGEYLKKTDLAEELIVARLFADAYQLAYGKEASNVLGG